MNIKSKFGYLCCASLLTTSLWAQDVLISTRNTSLLLDAPVGGEVRFIYYGDKLSTSDAATLLETEQKTFSAYPVYGVNCPSESALSVTHGREYDPSTGSHKSRYTKRANGRYHNDPIKR